MFGLEVLPMENKTIQNNGYTVKELIETLSIYPEDAVVYLHKKGDKYSYLLTTITDTDINIDGCITLTNEK